MCHSGKSFSVKLAEILDTVRSECTPILACFDVGSQKKHEIVARSRPRLAPESGSPLPSPGGLRRELTFSSETDESYGLQLLSRIASDLQVDEGTKLIIPVAVVQPQRHDSYDQAHHGLNSQHEVARAPYGSETEPAKLADTSDTIDPQLMLQCLDAGALDVVKSPLDKAGIMGLTVHAYRIYKSAKAESAHYMSKARGRGRKQSWVGVDEEKPYAYLREAMVRKLLKGICDPQEFIEDYQHRDVFIEPHRKAVVAEEVGKWSFSGQDFSDDELVYAGYYMLNHALQVPEVSKWQMSQGTDLSIDHMETCTNRVLGELLRFMQGCRVAYNSFVLYHNFKHAVDVLQSSFYFLLQIGVLPPYPPGSEPTKYATDKSPIAKLLGPFEAMTLLISAIGHDVGHPGVNNMFLVKLNAPLAQLYNDTSVLEAFHCAAYSQILRRHWPTVFHDKAIRKLMISSILATDMGCHSDYMQQLGNLQEKIHESKTTDSWTPKEIDANRVLACGLLIKCADISNVARPWAVAEKWTYKLQEEFAHQGEMENNIGMETTLFGGPPEIGNMLKLANGQIGFMTIFAHPLFANVTDIIPAMGFAAEEILINKGVWFTRAEHEKQIKMLQKRSGTRDGGVSPRSQSPVDPHRSHHVPSSPLRERLDAEKRDSSPSRTSGSKHAEGLVSPERKPTSRHTSAGTSGIDPKPLSSDASRHRDEASQPNGVTNAPESQNATPRQKPTDDVSSSRNSVSEVELNDRTRDNAVSMRAGSTVIPLKEEKEEPGADFSKFEFATSNVNEPVRMYDPNRDYSSTNPDSRASAPMNDVKHQEWKRDAAKEERPRPVQSESALSEREPNSTDGRATPTPSTERMSYTTDERSESHKSPPRTATSQSARDRALSTPFPQGQSMPPLGHTFSLNSNDSASHEGGKHDFRTTIFSNGDSAHNEKAHRKMSTRSVGRKRSKIKMGFAFWKKKNRDTLSEEEKHEATPTTANSN